MADELAAGFQLGASELFLRLQEFAEKPLPRGSKGDLCWVAYIEFPTDEEAHNDDLQAAASSLADSLLAMVQAAGRDAWGKPDYHLDAADEEFPAWTEDLLLGAFDRLVGWRRGRSLVAYALRLQEDREIPITVALGIVRWRGGTISE
jgi:hypothetical protein